jgi:hypothetical protein
MLPIKNFISENTSTFIDERLKFMFELDGVDRMSKLQEDATDNGNRKQIFVEGSSEYDKKGVK